MQQRLLILPLCLMLVLLASLVVVQPAPSRAAALAVRITGNSYDPANITVHMNDTVTWTNYDLTLHTVTAENASFDSGLISTGNTFSYTFTQPGVYNYYCKVHPYIKGTVTVLAPGGAADYPIANGHFYTQARGPSAPAGYGFAITDNGGIKFWSEFQRLGGVNALGYPASERFMLDGFWTQATQRVLLQWRPDVQQAYFVNVFDKLHDLGKDAALQAKYQVPPPVNVNDAGKPFGQVVDERLAYLNGQPALRSFYLNNVNNLAFWNRDVAIQLYGLPTSQVVDASGVFDIIRCQRIVIQYWKKSIPGVANAGQITVGLGGDISKEFGLVPADAASPKPPTQ